MKSALVLDEKNGELDNMYICGRSNDCGILDDETRKINFIFGIELVILFLACMYFYKDAIFRVVNDDAVYKAAIDTHGSWSKWANYFYNTVGGRVLIHAILIVLLNLPIVIWKILSSMMIVGTCYLITTYVCIGTSFKYSRNVVLAIVAALYFMIPVLEDSVLWASGSLNYLYPVCCLLGALVPFIKKFYSVKIKIEDEIIALLTVLICANMEQGAAVFAALGVFVFIFIFFDRDAYNRENLGYLRFLWLINLIILVVSYSAPGNQVRASGEMMKCSGYGMYTIIERLILGLQNIYLNFFYIKGILFWLMPTALAFVSGLYCKNKKRLCLSFINVILCALQFIIMRKVFNTSFIYPFDIMYYVWLYYSLVLIIFNGIVIVSVIRDYKEHILYLVLYLGAMAAIVVTGLAPTVFVSTHRTAYIAFILMLWINAKLFNEVLQLQFGKERNDAVANNQLKIHQLDNLFARVATVISFILCCVYYISVQTGSGDNIQNYILTKQYDINQIGYDISNENILFDLDVTKFKYEWENHCTGLLAGYDINVAIGEYDNSTGHIRLYKTILKTEWPTMFKYPNNRVSVISNYRNTNSKKMVLLVTTHNGEKLIQYLE